VARLVRLLRPLLLAFLATCRNRLDELVQTGPQDVQVADRVVRVDLLADVLDRGLCVLRGQVGGLHSLLEEADLYNQALVLALEVGQRLLRGARLPGTDDLLAVGRTHVHGPRLVDAAPRVAAHSASST